MRRLMPWMAVLVLAAVPAFGAAKKAPPKKSAAEEKREAMQDKWPSAREVQIAINKIDEWNKHRMTRTKFRGKNAEFWPTDIGRFNDEEKANGFILGKLVNDGESKDGLQPGQYYVYGRKEGSSRWEVYYFSANQVVAKSKAVVQNLEDIKDPLFKDSGGAVHYWRLKFDW